MSTKLVYLAIDSHARHCVLGCMNSRGEFLRTWSFVTCETQLIKHIEGIDARHKILAIEEGPLAFWIAQTLRPYVADIVISDPRENPLIARNAMKGDKVDVRRLCRLLRLGELKRVYHPEDDHRAVFKAAVQHYMHLRNQRTSIKQKIKAKYRTWGVPQASGTSLYHPGPRALIHRSLTRQRADYMALVKVVHPTKGLIVKHSGQLTPELKRKEIELRPIHHLVCTVVQGFGRTTYFKLTKLLYMANFIALERLGRTLTGEIYLRQVDGPWPPALKKTLPTLVGHEIVYDSKRRVPFVAPDPNPRFTPKIGEEAEHILAEVLGKYGHYSNSQIKTAAYPTKPMR
jgi:uncharacterized phage-associated protein